MTMSPGSKVNQRIADGQVAAASRRLPRPLRTRPVVEQTTDKAPSRASIRSWMRAHVEEHRDGRTGEVNATALVEEWDRECADGGVTMDPDHPAWEIAASLIT